MPVSEAWKVRKGAESETGCRKARSESEAGCRKARLGAGKRDLESKGAGNQGLKSEEGCRKARF